jgi:flagellar motor switch protein FliG
MTTKLNNDGLRKAAILVASLDTAAADAVLDQLAPEQARQVREIAVELDEIDQSERRRVIDDFFRDPQAGAPPPATMQDAGVELDGHLAWLASHGGNRGNPRLSEAPSAPLREMAAAPLSSAQPFRFLHETEIDKLVRAMASERPQTIALVLSHMPQARAGAVLARLPESVQVEVVHRLVELEETDPEILREVEEALRGRLAEHVQTQRRRVAGLQAVAGILQATDGRTGIRILDNLARGDRMLADQLMPRQMTFDDLADLDAEVLAEVIDEAEPELWLPALLGAAPELVARVLSCLPAADARALGRKLDHPGPIRLRDVEEARRQVARIANRVSYQVRS